MKRLTMCVAVMAIASTLAWSADDGAALYKTKCAACHGAAGEGKIGPALKGTKSDVAALLTKGAAGKKAPHAKGIAGMTPDQAKAVATYVKSLK